MEYTFTHLVFLSIATAIGLVDRDLWRQQNLDTNDAAFEAHVPLHDVVLLRLTPKR